MVVGGPIVERLDARVLPNVGAGGRGSLGQAPYEACRLQHAVPRMKERRRIALRAAPRERSRHSAANPRHAARRTRRAVRPAPPRRRRVGGCRSAGTRRRPALRAAPSSASVQRHRSAVASSPIDSASTGYGAAPPRSANPPLRPLALPAISRASKSRTFKPASASASAHEQPVMPPPMTATSGFPIQRSAARGSAGSSSQYEVVDMDPRS